MQHLIQTWLVVALFATTFAQSTLAQDRPSHLNMRENTADWLANLNTGEIGSYAIVGDSMSFRNNSYHWFLRDKLEAIYGNAGDGYLAFNQGFRHNPSTEASPREGLFYRRQSSTWAPFGSSQNARDDFGQRSPDGIYTRIGYVGWIEVDFYGPSATVHYIKESGAGMVNVRLNGNDIAQFDASKPSGDPELAFFTFSTGESDPTVLHTLRLSLIGATSQDPQWTQLNGLEMTTGNSGLLYHRIARGGAGPDNFLDSNLDLYAAFLQHTNPDVLFVMTDPRTDSFFDTYFDEMSELLTFFETTIPATEIILITHHAFKANRAIAADDLLFFAEDRGYGFVNFFDLHHNFNHLNSLGMLDDTVHFSPIGGEWYGSYMVDSIFNWEPIDAFTITAGNLQDGERYETLNSDDDTLDVQSVFGFLSSEPNRVLIDFEFEAEPDGSEIAIGCEWKLNNPGGTYTTSIFNWQSNQYQAAATGNISNTVQRDDWMIDNATGNLQRANDGLIQTRVKAIVIATFSLSGFRAEFDHVQVRKGAF